MDFSKAQEMFMKMTQDLKTPKAMTPLEEESSLNNISFSKDFATPIKNEVNITELKLASVDATKDKSIIGSAASPNQPVKFSATPKVPIMPKEYPIFYRFIDKFSDDDDSYDAESFDEEATINININPVSEKIVSKPVPDLNSSSIDAVVSISTSSPSIVHPSQLKSPSNIKSTLVKSENVAIIQEAKITTAIVQDNKPIESLAPLNATVYVPPPISSSSPALQDISSRNVSNLSDIRSSHSRVLSSVHLSGTWNPVSASNPASKSPMLVPLSSAHHSYPVSPFLAPLIHSSRIVFKSATSDKEVLETIIQIYDFISEHIDTYQSFENSLFDYFLKHYEDPKTARLVFRFIGVFFILESH